MLTLLAFSICKRQTVSIKLMICVFNQGVPGNRGFSGGDGLPGQKVGNKRLLIIN